MTSTVGTATTNTASNLASSLGSSTSSLNSALGGTGTSSAQDASQQLQNISDQINQIAQQVDSSKVQEFEKDTRDVQFDNNATARDAGRLTENKTRLNVISSLSANDPVDVFKFTVTTTADTKLGVLAAGGADDQIRYQVFSKSSGKLIADSDQNAGDAYKAYQDLSAGKLEMKSGDYVLRVSRADGVDPKNTQEFQYAVQLSQGIYTQDYDLVEKAYRAGTDDPFGLPSTGNAALSSLVDGLSTSYSFINSLPPIGSDATSKLTGALYDALF
jgi:hypothetical protein